MYIYISIVAHPTALLTKIEGENQVFQRFSSSKLVLKTVESRFAALDYYENGSIDIKKTRTHMQSFACLLPFS
jgi:hypothetical protein